MKLTRYPHNPILEANPDRAWESGAVFNCGATVGAVIREGTLYVCYGGADKCCCLATAPLDDLLDHLLAFRV